MGGQLSSGVSLLYPYPLGTFVTPFLQEQYLPYLLHAKLKIACNEELDPSLICFIENALQNEERKTLLEVWLRLQMGGAYSYILQDNYSDQLALFYILRDDNDRADYYIKALKQDWSNLNRLMSSTHRNKLHNLQKLREMKEYIQFVARKGTTPCTIVLFNYAS